MARQLKKKQAGGLAEVGRPAFVDGAWNMDRGFSLTKDKGQKTKDNEINLCSMF